MDGNRHLSIAERENIMVRWKGHEGVSQIARELGRDKSTVSREIGRNRRRSPSGRRYRASAAQGRADARRLRCKRPRLMNGPERRALVVGPMRDERWSPDQISGRIAMDRPDLVVSGKSIYRAVEWEFLVWGLPGQRKASVPHRRQRDFREHRDKELSGSEGPQDALGHLFISAILSIPGSAEPTRTSTGFSETGSRKTWDPDAATYNEIQGACNPFNQRPRNRLKRKRPVRFAIVNHCTCS